MIEPIIIAIIILIVALISFSLSVIGFLSYQKKNDIRLLSVSLAFFIFFIKNIITSVSYEFGFIQHGDLELFGALFDLLAMVLLLIPIFFKTNNTKLNSVQD